MPKENDASLMLNKTEVKKRGPRGSYEKRKWWPPSPPPYKFKRKNLQNTPAMKAARLRNLEIAREVKRRRPPRIW